MPLGTFSIARAGCSMQGGCQQTDCVGALQVFICTCVRSEVELSCLPADASSGPLIQPGSPLQRPEAAVVWGSLPQQGRRASRPQAARAQSRSAPARDSTLETAPGAQTSCHHLRRAAPAVVQRLLPRQGLLWTSRGSWHPPRMMQTQQELATLEKVLLRPPLPPAWTLRPWTTLAGLRHTLQQPLLKQGFQELRCLAAVSPTLLNWS